MKIILVDNGTTTAVYHDFHKNKLCTYNTADGVDGLMEALGVHVTKHIDCPNAKDGRLVDPSDGFPYHLDNLPDNKTTKKVVAPKSEPKKPTRKRTTKKATEEKSPAKTGRKAKRPPKRKT